MSLSPKILFIPVSSAEGIGEYMRSLILAEAIQKKWPSSEIQFVLSREAPYAKSCPYPTRLLNRSPTKEVQPVKDILTEIKPDIAIFDASGRASQLRHAKKVGSKVIFISQHRRKRSRGMKINRAFAIDAHLVAQPEFAISNISAFDKIKFRILNIEEPKCIGPIFTEPDSKIQFELLQKFGLVKGEYIIFNAGSGGHKINGELAANLFAKVAANGYKKHKIKCLFVCGPNYPEKPPLYEGVHSIMSLSNTDFVNLLASSKAAVLSGGGTLLQSIALNIPTLAIPVSKDQPQRISACEEHNLILTSKYEYESMKKAYDNLISEGRINHLQQVLHSYSTVNGVKICLSTIDKLLGRTQ